MKIQEFLLYMILFPLDNKRKVELDSFMESRDSPEYLRSYDKEALKNLDNYYINKKNI